MAAADGLMNSRHDSPPAASFTVAASSGQVKPFMNGHRRLRRARRHRVADQLRDGVCRVTAEFVGWLRAP
jgi:hypothetical protein